MAKKNKEFRTTIENLADRYLDGLSEAEINGVVEKANKLFGDMKDSKGAVDFHIHSQGSNCGRYPIEKLIEFAKEVGLDFMAITDHNTFSEVVKFWKEQKADLSTPVIDVDGIKVISGVEVTCRVSHITNLKGVPTKIHVLVYGANMSENSPLSRLLALKRRNDLDCDIGLLRDLLHYKKYTNYTEEDIRAYIREKKEADPGFDSLGKHDVWEFLQKHNINIATSYKELEGMLSHLPRYERLNVEFDDLFKVAKASGGLVVPAHLAINLNRQSSANNRALVDYLSNYVDGFEKYYNFPNSETWKLISKTLADKKRSKEVVCTGGSDFHDEAKQPRIGFAKGDPITVGKVYDFLNEMKTLSATRDMLILTHKDDFTISKEELEGIQKKYEKRFNEIHTNSAPMESLGAYEKRTKRETIVHNKAIEDEKKKAKKNKSKKTSKSQNITKKVKNPTADDIAALERESDGMSM